MNCWKYALAVLALSAGGVSAQSPNVQQPWVRGGVNVLYLSREEANSAAILRRPPAGPTLFDARSFDFDFEPGLETFVELDLLGRFGLDFRYFILDESISRATVTAAAPGLVNVGNTTLLSPNQSRLALQSELQGAEINLRDEWYDWLTLQLGFRWIEVNERLAIRTDGLPPVGGNVDFNYFAKNDLYGGQVGGEILWWEGDRLELRSGAKAGLYGNDAISGVELRFPANGLQLGAGRDSNTALAFLGDARSEAKVRLNDFWWLVGGGQLLFMDGVALATNQLRRTPTLLGGRFLATPTSTDADGSLFYYGGFAGFEGRW